MRLNRSVFVPETSVGRDWRVSIISALVTLYGVFFLNWSVSAIVFIFFWELIFIGAATLLRILLGARGIATLFSWIATKLLWGTFFVVMYGALLMLLIAFTLDGLHLESLTLDLEGVHQAVWLVGANHAAGLLFGFLLKDEYKVSTPVMELFATFFYVLPLAILMVFVVAPLGKSVGGSGQNMAIAAGIILLRVGIDALAIRVRQRVLSVHATTKT